MDNASFPLSSKAESAGVIVECSVLLTAGLFGSILMVAAMIQRLRVSCEYSRNFMAFVISLEDLLIILITAPLLLVSVHAVEVSPGACRAWRFLAAFSIWSGHITRCVGVLAEKCFAVINPFSFFGMRNVMLVQICTMVAGAALASPFAFQELPANNDRCGFPTGRGDGGISEEVWTAYAAVSIALMAVFYVVIAVLFVYLVRLWVKRRKNWAFPGATGNRPVIFELYRFCEGTKPALVLFLASLLYVACWVPYFLISYRVIPLDHRYVALFLFCNATNFLFHGVTAEKFREHMWIVLRCKRIQVGSYQ